MIESWEYKNRVFSFLKEEEISSLVDILHDSEVEKYLYFAPITMEGFYEFSMPIIKGQKAAFIEKRYPDSATFTITQNGELLGACGIDKMPDGHNIAMIGYQFKKTAWGRGVATSSLEFLMHYAKTYLKVRKLFGDCYSDNKASIRVLEKCGFRFEGTIKEKYEHNGMFFDNSWYGLSVDSAPTISADKLKVLKS